MSKEQNRNEVARPFSIPLKGITFRAAVNGAFARVRCIQEYKNENNTPVEAIYVFPFPDESTVVGCRMEIGKKKVIAELKKREEARQLYDEAVSHGHHAALAEEERPNIFTMNVGGIEPGETIRVELDYVQQIPWQAGGGRFTIPLVVAPRFIPGVSTGKSGGGWSPDTDKVPDASKITPPVAREGVDYNAVINIIFSPGFRCELSSPSHGMVVTTQTLAKNKMLEIKTGELRTDRDFILVYRNLSRKTETSAYTYKNFALVSLIPPGEVDAEAPSDEIYLLDVSGSMQGAKLEGLKTITKNLLRKRLAEKGDHRVGIIAFNDDYQVIYPIGKVSEEMSASIDKLFTSGCTQLGGAISEAFRQLGTTEGRVKTILVTSDGQTEAINFTGTGARIICAGIDAANNKDTLRNYADQTGGSVVMFYPGEDFTRGTNELHGMLSGPVFRDIKIDNKDCEAFGLQDAFKNRPSNIIVKFPKSTPKKLKITGTLPDSSNETLEIDLQTDVLECDYLDKLWAREFIRETQNVEKQTAISLEYGVICRHTSFVAISEKEVPGQKPVRVEIPVNLPHTWEMEEAFSGTLQVNSVTFRGGPAKGIVASRSSRGVDALQSLGLMGSSRRSSSHETISCFNDDALDAELGDEVLTIDNDPDDDGSSVLDTFDSPVAFDENSSDPIEVLMAILVKVTTSSISPEDATKVLAEKLTSKNIKTWTEIQKAQAFYLVLRFISYGIFTAPKIMDEICDSPKCGNPKDQIEALAWHALARKEAGLPYMRVPPPNVFDGANYIAWKLGQEERPTAGKWAQLP